MRGALPVRSMAAMATRRLAGGLLAVVVLVLLGLALLAIAFPAVAHAQTPPTADEAASLADAHPESVDAQFDAGVLLAAEDRLGESILYLERALLAAPLDRQVQDARSIVQRETRARRMEAATSRTVTEGEPVKVAMWRLFAVLPESTWAGAVLVGSWLAFGFLLVRRRKPEGGARDAATVGALVGAVVLVLAGGMWIGREWTGSAISPAVVVAASPAYRDAPDELSRLHSHPDLFEGGVVLVVERRPGWSQVELAAGERVWVADGVAVPLEPSAQPAP